MMLVLKADVDVSTEAKAKDIIGKLMGSEAKISEVTLMGKKILAYPIRKQKEGNYILIKLTGNIKVDQIEKQVKLNENVLRYLLLKR